MDGHVPTNFTLQMFDTTASLFSPKYSKGQNITWSQIIKLPDVNASNFDIPGDKVIEVTINDKSIFIAGGRNSNLDFDELGCSWGMARMR
jgi:hypothetical protein